MGAFCSCLQPDYSDHHGNQASSAFRNCMCLRCFTQQLINAYTVLFRAGAVHSVSPAIEATPVDSTESSFNTYRSPPRPLPYDDPRFSPPARDWLRRESPSHSPDESVPLRANDDDEEMETPSRIDKASKTNYNTKMKISSSAYGDKVPPRGHGNYFSYFSPSAEDEDVCPTCLEDYDSENPRIVMQCSHHFHLGCIYEWMERSEACPVCGKALVLARSQTRQSELFASQAETERQDKDRRLKELEKENAALKKAAEDERTARRQAQREAKKLKGELTTLRSSFDEDRAGISALADGLVSKYVQCLKSTGVLSDGPGESDLRGCLAWLRRELDALEGHMSLSCDYASAAGIKAIGVSLLNVGCSHTADLAVADVDACWRTPPEVKILGKKFFEEFWLGGGNDMALIQSAVGRAKTSEERAQIR